MGHEIRSTGSSRLRESALQAHPQRREKVDSENSRGVKFLGCKLDMTADLPFESAQLLARCTAGDSLAEEQLFERYVVRLTLLARSRLSQRLASRVDPEDIVLSAYRSFFLAARQQRFELRHSGDLWRLLVKITLAKVVDQVEFHQAQRRTVNREQRIDESQDSDDQIWLAVLARDPSPAEVAQAIEELERLRASMPPLGAQVVQLRLQGYRQDEIAEQLNCAERTVRRWLERAGEFLTKAESPQS
jgi:RNA polymerase sigma factor (sigma-70 family)